jgi:hypothetical protein
MQVGGRCRQVLIAGIWLWADLASLGSAGVVLYRAGAYGSPASPEPFGPAL